MGTNNIQMGPMTTLKNVDIDNLMHTLILKLFDTII